MASSRRRTAATVLPCAILLATGCTTVVIHTDGAVRTQTYFGVLNLSIDDARVSAVALSGVGIVTLPGSFSLGWLQWRGASIGQRSEDTCLLIDFGPQATGRNEP